VHVALALKRSGFPVGAINRLKRLVGTTQPGEYECRSCGTAYPVEHYTCPECGSFSVERTPEPVAD
jgi:rRNA maturation endonuclease Nob1